MRFAILLVWLVVDVVLLLMLFVSFLKDGRRPHILQDGVLVLCIVSLLFLPAS